VQEIRAYCIWRALRNRGLQVYMKYLDRKAVASGYPVPFDQFSKTTALFATPPLPGGVIETLAGSVREIVISWSRNCQDFGMP
jgi:hypothetical protein